MYSTDAGWDPVPAPSVPRSLMLIWTLSSIALRLSHRQSLWSSLRPNSASDPRDLSSRLCTITEPANDVGTVRFQGLSRWNVASVPIT
eukprot:1988301-Rhodomonas_salina.1